MGEWKRVFLSRQREFLVVLLTAFCLMLFFGSLLGNISPNAIRNTFEAAEYGKELYTEWSGMTFSELEQASKAERERLITYGNWVNGYSFIEQAFDSDGEANASVADLPYLVAQSENIEDFNRAYSAYMEQLKDIESEISHLSGYADYLAGIQAQAAQQSQVSIFNRSNSFSSKNLQKTAEDFKGLDGTEVSFGNNIGVERWLDFTLADYFFLAAMTVFVLAFLEERKKGLWNVVRSCKNGRLRLGLHRLGILCAASLLCTALIYVLPFFVSMAINGGFNDLNHPLQSLESFRTCALNTTVSAWLLRYFAVKVLSGVMIGLLLWCVLGSISNAQFSVSVLGVILVGEYLLYELLPVQSFMNILKYFNIFSYVHTSDLYTKYLNVNLFGQPVGIRGLMLAVLPIALFVLAIWALLIQSKRYPEGNKDLLSKLSAVINRGMDILRSRLTIGGWEVYKTLVFEFGVIIIIGVLILTKSLVFNVYIQEPDTWYQMYLSDSEGMIDETTDDYFERAKSSIAKNSNEAAIMSAIQRLESEVDQIKSAAEAGGYEPWIIDQKTYNSFYGPASRDRQRLNATAAIFLLVLCCAGVFAYERQSGVVPAIRSPKRGRGALFLRKVMVCALMAAFVWAAVYVREFAKFISLYGADTLGAPVQNISALAAFPLKATFGQYLAILYGARLVMLVMTAFVILAISQCAANVQISYVLGFGILGLPALLTIFGADIMKYLSPLVPISSAEIMWNIGSGSTAYMIPWVLWAVVGILSLVYGCRKWTRG